MQTRPRNWLHSLCGIALTSMALAACMGSTALERSGPPGGGGTPGGADGGSNTSQGPNPPGSGSAAPGTSKTSTGRVIQEADIYKLAGNTLYILNSYRGLQIVDVTNVDSPQLVGHVPVVGSPRDIYIEGTTAYVLVSDYFDYDCGGYHGRCGFEAVPGITTELMTIDVTNPSAPVVLGQFQLPGDLQDSRIVGHILYVLSNEWNWQQWDASEQGTTYVASFDITNPQAVTKVDEQDFDWSQWDVGIYANVTATRIILAEAGDECDWKGGNDCSEDRAMTQFQPIDISDPNGKLQVGTPFHTDGIVQDRWAMDFDTGTNTLRAVLSNDWNTDSGGGSLVAWSAPTVNSATQLGSLSISIGNHIAAAAFDGPRVYVSTASCTDPIVILDTTDPTKPAQLGSVSLPGSMDLLLPVGDRLIGLGHADSTCTAFSGKGQLNVSLFDVSDATKPVALSQVNFGGDSSFLAASRSDLRKAFLVLGQLGLILVPYQNPDWTTYQAIGGTQLIDYDGNSLKLRGMAPQQGLVERAFPVADKVVSFSDQKLQVLDISDRDNPRTTTQLDLARPVLGLAVVGSNVVELSGDPDLGNAELAVAGAATPEQPVPSAVVPVAAPNAQSFQDGNLLWVLASDPTATTPAAWLQATDVSNPAAPVARGKLMLDPSIVPAGYATTYAFSSSNRVVLVNHALVMLAPNGAQLQIVDVEDPDAPKLLAPITLNGTPESGLTAVGNAVWLTHSAGSDYLDQIDLTTPSAPKASTPVQIPGVFLATADGTTIYVMTFNGITEAKLQAGTATTTRTVAVSGQPGGGALNNGFLYVVSTQGGNEVTLSTIGLSTMQVTNATSFGANWLDVLAAAQGKLFVETNWTDTGIMVFDLADPSNPSLQGMIRTDDYVESVVINGSSAYVVGGYYGSPRIDLTPGSPLVLNP